MPLPHLIRSEFVYVDPQTTQESDYYGAYNLLLSHAFPPTDGYVVHPQVIFHLVILQVSYIADELSGCTRRVQARCVELRSLLPQILSQNTCLLSRS